MISTIYRHELISMFRTPFAWLLLGLCAALLAYQFLAQIEFYMSVADKLATMEQAARRYATRRSTDFGFLRHLGHVSGSDCQYVVDCRGETGGHGYTHR